MDDQIGLEQTPDAFVEQLVDVFREVKRILRDDGTLWLNLGDSYASYRDGKATPDTTRGDSEGTLVPKGSAKNRMASTFAGSIIKHKDLIGIPWRVAFALQADGWYLRQDIIWHKPNPMPESVQDRCTKSHEYIFLLSKSPKYYFDHDAIKEQAIHGIVGRKATKTPKGNMDDRGVTRTSTAEQMGSPDGKKNKRSVWTVTTKPFKGAHFATFPFDLIEPCILAGCPEGGTVLDPFGGAGTTGLVASRHNRNAILCELNPEYIILAEKRIKNDNPLFNLILN
jgi:site-specific DNA-methyltransferase (adenine-specific)